MLLAELFLIGIIVFIFAAQWKIYQKADQPGWASIIPIYNLFVLLKIIGKPGWWFLMFLIPGVNLIFAIWATNLLSKSFGKDEGFTAGLVLLGIVFYPILGFGSAEYQGPFGDPVAFNEYQSRHTDFGKDYRDLQ